MKEKLRFTEEQIALANSINIIDYARRAGYEVRQVAPRSFKIPGFGGLYIHSDGHKWNCFSQEVGGGAIQFVMFMEGKSWVDAVKQLLDTNPASYAYQRDNKEDEEIKKGEFILPEKNNTFKHLFAYLIGRRKIDKEIVYDLVKRDKLYENKYRSCVFVGHDREGIPRFASIRSTNAQGQSFRCDVANSDKAYSFSIEGSTRTVCIFESPIDLMSYLTFIKLHGITNFNDHMLSLGGLSDKALERYLKDYHSITRLTLCLDNDEAGRFASEQLKNKYRDRYEIRCHLPRAKDWNEELVSFKSALEQQEGMIRAPGHEYIEEAEVLLSQ